VIFSSVYLLVRSLLACVMVLARREVSKDARQDHLAARVRRSTAMSLLGAGVDTSVIRPQTVRVPASCDETGSAP
jgi:hypothetical protein